MPKNKKVDQLIQDDMTDEVKAYIRQQLDIETTEMDIKIPTLVYLKEYLEKRKAKLEWAYSKAYNHYDIVDDSYYPSINANLDYLKKEFEAIDELKKLVDKLLKGRNQ
jgi:hypothetical protein